MDLRESLDKTELKRRRWSIGSFSEDEARRWAQKTVRKTLKGRVQ